MRIAIVGAGVSGLVAAHLLHERHEIVVFEAAARPGGHTHTVRVDTEDATHWVDTGFIVFNDRNYPRFEALLAELGVAAQPSDMSFGVSDGDFEYASTSPNGLFAKRSHLVSPSFQRMIADVPRFQRRARELLSSTEEPTLREWLATLGVSDAFVERVIVPQAAAVWSADPEQMWTFPARFLVAFFANHGMLGLRDRAVRGEDRVRIRDRAQDLRRVDRVRAVERHAELAVGLERLQAVHVIRHGSPAEWCFQQVVVPARPRRAPARHQRRVGVDAQLARAVGDRAEQLALQRRRV
jgi:predicted NAD/FAD-binding protein